MATHRAPDSQLYLGGAARDELDQAQAEPGHPRVAGLIGRTRQ
jgi:hypothetical protein